ncbi:MAG: cobalt-precorrin-5B [Geobacteraceae bacterium]|nr:MAG: cobalt-precorrin-5B [Geobacteraceae bacterium]
MLREQRLTEEVEITLPMGETARFHLHGQEFTGTFAACYVVKDAGDDPDVTNGAEIHARVMLAEITPSPRPSPARGEGEGEDESRIGIEGGIGIGKVTKPGLAVPVGQWAINPVPRRMIAEAIAEVFPRLASRVPLHVTLSIPNGEELAKKTLNARLGIIGGLSILGTTGIVKPISAKAWTDTIDAAIDVARACGAETIVFSTGRTSELVAQKFFGNREAGSGKRDSGSGEKLKEEAFVMMGDHVGYALRACARKEVRRVVLAGQFAKLLKIACGHEQTHVSSSELDLRMLAEWCGFALPASRFPLPVREANTARQILEASGNDAGLIALVCERAREFAERAAPGLEVKVLLAGYHGEMLYFG